MNRTHTPAALAAAAALLAVPVVATPAAASEGRDGRVEVREAGSCTPGGAWRLRLRGEDDELRVDAQAALARPGRGRPSRWRVVVVHERRTVIRRTQALPATGLLRVRAVVGAYAGSNTVTVRMYGPRGQSCHATAAAVLPLDD